MENTNYALSHRVTIRSQALNRVAIYATNFNFAGDWYTSKFDETSKTLVIKTGSGSRSPQGTMFKPAGSKVGLSSRPFIFSFATKLAGKYVQAYQENTDIEIKVEQVDGQMVYIIPFDLKEDPTLASDMAEYHRKRNARTHGRSIRELTKKAVPSHINKTVAVDEPKAVSSTPTKMMINPTVLDHLLKAGYSIVSGTITLKDVDGNVVDITVI
jgi:hypothetical protein